MKVEGKEPRNGIDISGRNIPEDLHSLGPDRTNTEAPKHKKKNQLHMDPLHYDRSQRVKAPKTERTPRKANIFFSPFVRAIDTFPAFKNGQLYRKRSKKSPLPRPGYSLSIIEAHLRL